MKTGGDLEIIPLGAGCEIGRSCIVVNYQGHSVMLDCGIHPAHTGIGALPIFDAIDVKNIDLCLVTHFHLDHCGAVPYFLCKTDFRGRVYMTEPTLSICNILWADYARLSAKEKADFQTSVSGDDDNFLYEQEDLEKAVSSCYTIDFNQEMEWKGIKFTCFSAGHVLGACMFLIEINGVRVLYTGDYSIEIDRHIPAAVIPQVDVHVLICEATYGVRVHDERNSREQRFLKSVQQILLRNGKCLLPVFSLGRAQELLFILEEFWEDNPNIQKIPLINISNMSEKSMIIYETFINMCGNHVKKIAQEGRNPFQFRHVHNFKNIDKAKQYIHSEGPCVIMAAPGMLQNGVSMEIFEAWAHDSRNGVILTGYTVKGTLADELKSEPEVIKISDKNIKRRCTFEQISFSAHADFVQTQEFIEKLRAPNVVLVHGERGEMSRLKDQLQIERPALSVFTPEILQKVSLEFSSDNCIRAVGRLALDLKSHFNYLSSPPPFSTNSDLLKDPPKSKPIEGVIIKDDHNMPILLDPRDINEYSCLEPALITQKLRIKFDKDLKILYDLLSQIYEKVIYENDTRIKVDSFLLIQLDKQKQELVLFWNSNPLFDLVADSVSLLALEITSQDITNISKPTLVPLDLKGAMLLHLKSEYTEAFPSQNRDVEMLPETEISSEMTDFWIHDPLTSSNVLITIDFKNQIVSCDDARVKSKVSKTLQRLYDSLNPYKLS